MGKNLEQFLGDPFSNDSCVHVSGSEAQSKSEKWFKFRRHRVTASSFKDWSSKPLKKAKEHWTVRSDLSHVASISWGSANEDQARRDYEAASGSNIQICGLFISKKIPFVGASPDGIAPNQCKILELKCPFVLQENSPTYLDSLSCAQRLAFCCTLDENNNMILKKSHQYFAQVQCQMWVTGYKKTDFVI